MKTINVLPIPSKGITKSPRLKASILLFIERNAEKYMVIRLVQGFILGAAVTGLLIFMGIKLL